MKNKFQMPLTWHNCYSCPPEEPWNDDLWVTNGVWVFPAEYIKTRGWYDKNTKECLPFEMLSDYYWADLKRTVRGCPELKED